MENYSGPVSLEKNGDGFSFSAPLPMKGQEIYLNELSGTTRTIIIVSTVINSEFRVVFNSEPTLSRNTDKPVLCFVIGQDGNSRTVVREGNPGVVLAETQDSRALLPKEKEIQMTFWFSFDASIRLASFGTGNQPNSESTLLVVPDWHGCFNHSNNRIFIGLANWEQPVQLNIFNHSISGLRLNNFPTKFNDDKTMKSFHGLTCICRINEKSHGSVVSNTLIQAQEILKATGRTVGGCFSFLPPESFHMTLADLITSENRWTACAHIPGEMKEVQEEIRQRSKEIFAMATSNVFYMKMDGISFRNGLSIRLKPYEEKTAEAMAAWRDYIYKRLGISYPKDYGFHIGLAYRILPINESNARTALASAGKKIFDMLTDSGHFALLPISAPELCIFADMSAYQKI